jgi:N-methylhydantoinase B
MDVEEPAVANTAGDGVRHAPYGLLGGQDGLPHRYRLLSRGRRPRVLKTKEVGILVRPGDVFLVESSGGGGFGPPSKRPPETRARDLENGVVTRRGRAANSRRRRAQAAR